MTVNPLHHSGRRTALMNLLGILFCGLLIAFAVTSKVAACYPHDVATRPITAAKMWQQDVAVKVAPPVQAAPALLLFVVVLVAAAEGVRRCAWMLNAAAFPATTQLCFRSAYASRPPPHS
jgi:hypothetical protein